MSDPDERRTARNRLLGRALIIGLGLLAVVYFLAMFVPRQT
jgi:hypothetical protein